MQFYFVYVHHFVISEWRHSCRYCEMALEVGMCPSRGLLTNLKLICFSCGSYVDKYISALYMLITLQCSQWLHRSRYSVPVIIIMLRICRGQ